VRREPRASADLVAKAVARFDTELPNLEAIIERGLAAGNVRRVAPMAAKMLLRSAHHIRVAYAAGTPIDEIVPLVRVGGDRWTWVYELAGDAAAEPAVSRYLGPALLLGEGGYSATVDLLAWATALGEAGVVQQVAATPPVEGASDAVIDTLLRLGGVAREVTAQAIFPELMAEFVTLAAATAAERPATLADHVTSWEVRWLGTGTLDEPGSDHYVGNWCFDIAPLVVVLDIDDAAVRDHPNYPTDLIDAARRLR
jgi:hypothetical protein